MVVISNKNSNSKSFFLLFKIVEIFKIFETFEIFEAMLMLRLINAKAKQERLKIWKEHSTLILLISIPFEVVQQKFLKSVLRYQHQIFTSCSPQ